MENALRMMKERLDEPLKPENMTPPRQIS